MRLELGDELVWDGVRFELVALDATQVRLRAVEEGFVRVAFVADVVRDPLIEWPQRTYRRSSASEEQLLVGLTEAQKRDAEMWLPHLRQLDVHLAQGHRDSAATRAIVDESVHCVGGLRPRGSVDSRTVWRKLDAYRAQGVIGLVYKSYRSPIGQRRDPKLLEIVSEVCRKANWESTGTIGRAADDIRYAIGICQGG